MALVPLLSCYSKFQQPQTDNAPFENATDKGLLENSQITEASGLAASRSNKGLIWTHNDSGDAPRLFLLDSTGHDKGTYYLAQTKNRDWEDMDAATINGKNYLYIADIGDNDQKHNKKYIYRVEEPVVKAANKPQTDTIRMVETFLINYPDANRNAEALMIDQQSGDLYIVSKFESNVTVYFVKAPLLPRLAANGSDNKPNMAQVLMTLPLTYITAATISPDNQEILMKNLDNVYYWKREKDESIANALKRPATILPYNKEAQGEAIAFAFNKTGYYTLSEKKKKIMPHLYFYKRK